MTGHNNTILAVIAPLLSQIVNVGPRSFGDIHPEEQVVLRQIGTKLRDLAL